MLKRWIALAALVAALSPPGAALAQTSDIVPDIATIRSTNLGAYTQLIVEGYYGNGTPGGGSFWLQGGACSASPVGYLTSGSPTFGNFNSAQLYVGESVTNATYLPAGTTVSAIKFTGFPSAGTLTHSSSTVTGIPDTSNITVGMTISAPHVPTGTTVTAVSAPASSVTTTGTLNNGFVITDIPHGDIVTLAGLVGSGSVFAELTSDATTLPKTSKRSAIKPGMTISSVDTVNNTVTLTGSLGITGTTATSQAHLLFTTGGQVTLSANATANDTNEQNVIFFARSATLSQNALSTPPSTVTLTANGDDGGMHVIDSAGHCFARNSTPPDILGWGAKCDDSHDDTGQIQNAEIFAETSNSYPEGVNRSVRFPSSGGPCTATQLQILRPVPWLGDGRQQAVIKQRSGISAPLVYVFVLYDPSAEYPGLSHPELAFQDLRLTGNGAGSDIGVGMEVDGYLGGDDAPNGVHMYMRNLTIDNFQGFAMLADRDNQVIGRGFNVQLKGVTNASGAQDCLHVDGPVDTWHFYDLVQSDCDYGQYLVNTTSWAEDGSVAFFNNHAVYVGGSAFSGKNSAQVVFKDEEFGNNRQNGFIVNSNGARVICEFCRVQDSGNGTANTYSDYEITKNATMTNGPALTITGGLFTDINANNGSFFHEYNINFDSGSTAQVVVDGTTTTAATGRQIYTNLAGCSCTATMVGEQNLVATTSLLDPVLPKARLTMGGDYTASNSCLSQESAASVFLEACDASAFSNLGANSVRLRSGTPSSSTYIQVQAPNSLAGNYNFNLPLTAGALNTVLTSQGGPSQTWADVSRLVSSYNHSTGATITVPGRLVLSIAYQLFDFERSGPTANYTDTWDTATNILAGYGGAGNVTVGVPLRGVVCNNTAVTETFAAGTGVTLAGTTTLGGNACLHVSLIFTNTGTPAVTITGAS